MTLTLERTPVPTTTFPTVTRDELEEQADLQTRVDRKYLLPLDDLPALLGALPHRTRVLQIDRHRSFAYASTYFDTGDLRLYQDAARRRRRRFKVRTRVYADSGLCRLEVKTRGNRHHTVKAAIPYHAGDASRLTPAGAALITSQTGSSAWADALRPVLRTHYRRTTFVLPDEPGRLTIDVDLEVNDLHGREARVDGWAIVETKGGPSPGTADRVLWRLGHRTTKISKYGVGLALLHPDLHAHKWHRTLAALRAGQPRGQPLPTPASNPHTGALRPPWSHSALVVSSR